MSSLLVELAVGRQLTEAEQAIDVAKLDRALAKAKDLLNAAIHEEMLRATLVWIANGTPPRLSVTTTMRAIIDDLYEIGREEAWLEMERLGYDLQGRRHYIEEGPDGPADVPDYLSRGLRGIEIRIEDDLVVADLSGAASAAVARAVMQLPGARDLASRAISTALIGGFASTFDQVEDLVPGWQYTAILDGGTCDVCRPLDGTVYATLEQLFRVLPNYGPNPRCYGGGRCRCRAVPLPADTVTVDPEAPPPPRPADVEDTLRLPSQSIHGDVLAELTTARRTIASVHKLPTGTPTVPVRIKSMRAATGGQFDPRPTVPDISINSSGDTPSLTLAHEFGHAIDWHVIGPAGGMGTEAVDPAVRGLFNAIEASPSVRKLIDWFASPPLLTHTLPDGRVIQFRPPRDFTDYLLEPAELFARAYAQWIAVRSGDRTMLAQLDLRRNDPYPAHWNDDEFEPIAAALDRLAEEQGWTSTS